MLQDTRRLPVLVLAASDAETLRSQCAQSTCLRTGVWEVNDPVLGSLVLIEEQQFPPRCISTVRLDLRPLKETDGPALFAGHGRHPESMEYLTVRRYERVEEARAYARRQEAAWDTGSAGVAWAVCLGGDSVCVGVVDLVRRGTEGLVGFAVFQPHWGQGYATEALAGLFAAAMADPSLDRIEAVSHPCNHASHRVLTKAGMVEVGRETAAVVYPNRTGDSGDLLRWVWVRSNGVHGRP